MDMKTIMTFIIQIKAIKEIILLIKMKMPFLVIITLL